MKIKEIIQCLEEFAAPELQENYDNSGMLTGNALWDCTGVLCTLDVTIEIIEEAIAKKCNLIVAHHPVIFKELKSLTGINDTEKILIEAIKSNMAIYAAHTNMDNVVSGVNAKIAEKLGLRDLKILDPKPKLLRKLITFAPKNKADQVRKALFDAGAGSIGKYAECSFNSEGIGTFTAEAGADPYLGEVGKNHLEKEIKIEIVYPAYLERQIVKALVAHHPYEEVAYDLFTMNNIHFGIGAGIIGTLDPPLSEEAVLHKLKTSFGTGVIKHSALSGDNIKKVALCGGSGSFLIDKAINAGADIFVTSEVKYHEFFMAQRKIVIADIGHYETEQYTAELFQGILLKKFPTFAVLKTEVNTNPIKYFT